MKLPSRFYKPLAIGAPEPARELPVRLERMIHFMPPHIEKLRAKVPDLISKVDVVLGNLEDARASTAELWQRLSEDGGEGMEFSILAYETCAHVFEASGDLERAGQAFEQGYEELRARAERIGDLTWREAFLENVPEHYRLAVRWEGEDWKRVLLQ